MSACLGVAKYFFLSQWLLHVAALCLIFHFYLASLECLKNIYRNNSTSVHFMLMCVLRVFVCLLTCSHVTVGLLALFAIDLCIIFKCPLHVTCPQHLCDAYNFMAPFCSLSSKITAVQFQQIVILQTADYLLKIKIPNNLSPNRDIFL